MYLVDEEVKDDTGQQLASRADFEPPFDVVPVADPEIFSDIQRMAQLQIIADRAAAMPEVYNQKEVERRILERTKIPNPDELLLPDNTPQEQNAVNENASMSMGRPVAAFPDQDHLAHLQVHLDFAQSPVLGSFPMIAPTYLPLVLQHLVEHMTLYYVQYNIELLQATANLDDDELTSMLKLKNPKVRKELDKNLAMQSKSVTPAVGKVLSGIIPVVQGLQQTLEQYKPQPPTPPVDPNTVALVEQARETEQMRDDRERKKTQLTLVDKQQAREHQSELKFMELDAEQKRTALDAASEDARKANEYAARLRELHEREQAAGERVVMQTASSELMNTEDNRTALEIADVEATTRKATAKAGKNPNPSP